MGVVHGEEMVLNIGPQHPATHGVLRLQVRTDGEVVSEITPHMGYLHRCFEKHCENVTYEQVIPFTDRCDYLSSMSMNFGYVVAMEKLMDIKVNEKVEHIRVVMAELQRIASHLLCTGVFGLDLGAFTPFLWALRDRERILDLFELKSIMSSGNLVSDEILNSIVSLRLKNERVNGFILDGYPRTIAQSKFLDNFLMKNSISINHIFNIQINFQTLQERILKRSSEESRDDDKIEVIETRYNEYLNSTQKVTELYKEKNSNIFYEIDGSLQIQEITEEIRQILKIS